MGFLLRRGVKKERLFEKKKFLLFTPQKTVHGTFENGPPPNNNNKKNNAFLSLICRLRRR